MAEYVLQSDLTLQRLEPPTDSPRAVAKQETSPEQRRMPRRGAAFTAVTAVAGALALVTTTDRSDAATLHVPKGRYYCPGIYNFGTPYQEQLSSLESPDRSSVIQSGAELVVRHNNRAHSYLHRRDYILGSICMKDSRGAFAEYQVANIGPDAAKSTSFQFVPTTNLTGVRIQSVVDPYRGESLDSVCEVSPDRSKVDCDLGIISSGSVKTVRVNFNGSRPVKDEELAVGVATTTPETYYDNNQAVSRYDILPPIYSPMGTAESSYRYRLFVATGIRKRISARCHIVPMVIRAPKGKPLYNGKIKVDITASSVDEYDPTPDKRFVRRFSVLNHRGITLPYRTCNTYHQREVDAEVYVQAINTEQVHGLFARTKMRKNSQGLPKKNAWVSPRIW